MKIALHGKGEIGVSGRGIGAYTKLLFDNLRNLSTKEDFSVELVDTNSISEDELSKRFDLIHFPSFDFFYPTLNPPSSIPFVVTVHDTIPLIFPKHYPPGIKGTINLYKQKRKLRQSAAIITDSNTSQKDIVRFLGIKNTKIFPIYLGATKENSTFSPSDTKTILSKYNISFPFITYIGDVNWNKNILGLAKACEDKKIHLVIIGKKAVDSNYDRNHVENISLRILQEKYAESKYIHRIGFVEDREAECIIKNSILLCQPSFYEGFGLNVLDAMNLGVPTVCAKTQTLVELYEDASVFFDPYNTDDIGKTLSSVIEDKKLQKELVKKGDILSNKFSWKNTAKETYEVYKNILR